MALTYSFPNLEPVRCSRSGSSCCFLTCIQVFQESGKVVQYSHLFQNFPQFVVIDTVKGFGIVKKTRTCYLTHYLALAFEWQASKNICPQRGEIISKFGINIYTLLCLKQRINKDLPYITGISTQYSIIICTGKDFLKKKEYTYNKNTLPYT